MWAMTLTSWFKIHFPSDLFMYASSNGKIHCMHMLALHGWKQGWSSMRTAYYSQYLSWSRKTSPNFPYKLFGAREPYQLSIVIVWSCNSPLYEERCRISITFTRSCHHQSIFCNLKLWDANDLNSCMYIQESRNVNRIGGAQRVCLI